MKKIECEGEKISSTLIRNMIFSGEMEKIPQYLGDFYQIKGRIHLNKQNAEIIVNPYYLLPASGFYEVTVTNKQVTTKQIALVTNGMLKVTFPFGQSFPFRDSEIIRLYWKKRLPKEFLNQGETRPELIGLSL